MARPLARIQKQSTPAAAGRRPFCSLPVFLSTHSTSTSTGRPKTTKMAAVANAPAVTTVSGNERGEEVGGRGAVIAFAWHPVRARTKKPHTPLFLPQVGAGKEFATIADTPEWKALVAHVDEIQETCVAAVERRGEQRG